MTASRRGDFRSTVDVAIEIPRGSRNRHELGEDRATWVHEQVR